MLRSRSLALALLTTALVNCGGIVFDPSVGAVRDDDDGVARDGGADGSRGSADAGVRDASSPRPDSGPAVCGDGVVANGEPCDDGNRANGDGCTTTCQVERGWKCSAAPSRCDTVCGDGIVVGSETCDDDSVCPGTCKRSSWTKVFGPGQAELPAALAVDNTGASLVTGYFSPDIDFGLGKLTSSGSSDIYVAKIDANGNTVWARRFGGTEDDRPMALATDSAGNVFVTGVFLGTVDFGGGPLLASGSWDVYVLKLDTNGNHVWSKRFGDYHQQEGHAIAVDATGNVLVAGMAWGAIDFGGGPLVSGESLAGFVAKLDSLGNHVWSKHIGTSDASDASAVAFGPAGEVFVSGTCEGTTDLGEGPVARFGNRDGFLLALDASGQYRWSKKWGSGYTQGRAVKVDAAGDIVVAGSATGPTDFGTGVLPSTGLGDIIIGKFSPSGAPIFGRRYGSPKNDYAFALATDASSNIVVTGYNSGPFTFGSGTVPFTGAAENAFVIGLSPSGTPLWNRSFSGRWVRGLGIGVDLAGSVLLTGSFDGGLTFGGVPFGANRGLFVAKVTP